LLYELVCSPTNESGEAEHKAATAANEQADTIDHNEGHETEEVGYRVATWLVREIATIFERSVVAEYPCTPNDNPDEEKKGQKALETVSGSIRIPISVRSFFFIFSLLFEDTFEQVNDRLYKADATKHNQPYWDCLAILTVVYIHRTNDYH
jgi:hypothetical protein